MRVAGEVVEHLELAEDGHRGRGAQGLFELIQSGDFPLQQQCTEHFRVERVWSHYGIVSTSYFLLSTTYQNIWQTVHSDSMQIITLVY
jgi:hypothetical protein